MSKSRALIADDHQILAEGLGGLLEPEFEVVGAVDDGRELVAAAKAHRPDVIVADVIMPSLQRHRRRRAVARPGLEDEGGLLDHAPRRR